MVAFLTRVRSGESGATVLPVPLDVPAHFGGRERPAVLVTVGGHTFRSTIARMEGEFVLPLNRENREAAGLRDGQAVEVELAEDTEQRVVDPPTELASALAGDQEAREVFGSLPYSHQREYAEWVAEAQRPETRERRAAKTIDLLREGRTGE